LYGEFYGAYGYNNAGVAVMEMNGLGLGGKGVGGFPPGDPWALVPLKESALRSPSQMIAFGDTTVHLVGSFGTTPYPRGWLSIRVWNDALASEMTSDNSWAQAFNSRHNGSWNHTFCDGHVERGRFKLLATRDNNWLARWNNDNQPHFEVINIP